MHLLQKAVLQPVHRLLCLICMICTALPTQKEKWVINLKKALTNLLIKQLAKD